MMHQADKLNSYMNQLSASFLVTKIHFLVCINELNLPLRNVRDYYLVDLTLSHEIRQSIMGCFDLTLTVIVYTHTHDDFL